LVPWDHRGAGTTLGRNAKAGNGEMPVDRRVVGAIEAFEFLARHLRTDKVILLAESMGTLPAVSLVKRRPDPTRWPGAWNANMAWAFRANRPTPKLDRRLVFPRVALGPYRSDKVDRWVGGAAAGRTGRGFAAGVP
jgi:pimeloyl-ACP methyl ester carboxylesterase